MCLTTTDRNALLDRILPFPRNPQIRRYLVRPHNEGILPYAVSGLVNPLLGAGGEMDICGSPVWVFAHVVVLL